MADAGVGELEQIFMVEEAAWYEAKLVLGTDVPAAGEIIALGLTLRNRWGKGDDLTVTLDTLSNAGIPDPYITIRNPTVDYDSIGTYSTQDAGRIPYQPGSVNAQFTVMPAQEDPVCGLRLEYDPAVVECLSVGSATCTQPGGTFQLCLGCGSRIPLDTVPAKAGAAFCRQRTCRERLWPFRR